jgi:putative Mn2+ efflux pump MntP
MSLLEIIMIGIGLSMDCFAVAVSLATSRHLYGRYILKTALFFGFFQGTMPVAGYFLGGVVKPVIESVDHWIALGILSFIGIRLIVHSFSLEQQGSALDIRRTSVLLTLSLATSIDALMTGITFGFAQVNIHLAALIITIITFLSTLIGAWIGGKTTFLPARWAEWIGGLVLISIGMKIFLDHIGVL